MTRIILDAKNDKEAILLLEIAKRMNIKGRKLLLNDMEDIGLANAMEKGRTGKYVNTNAYLKKLRGKWM